MSFAVVHFSIRLLSYVSANQHRRYIRQWIWTCRFQFQDTILDLSTQKKILWPKKISIIIDVIIGEIND